MDTLTTILIRILRFFGLTSLAVLSLVFIGAVPISFILSYTYICESQILLLEVAIISIQSLVFVITAFFAFWYARETKRMADETAKDTLLNKARLDEEIKYREIPIINIKFINEREGGLFNFVIHNLTAFDVYWRAKITLLGAYNTDGEKEYPTEYDCKREYLLQAGEPYIATLHLPLDTIKDILGRDIESYKDAEPVPVPMGLKVILIYRNPNATLFKNAIKKEYRFYFKIGKAKIAFIRDSWPVGESECDN